MGNSFPSRLIHQEPLENLDFSFYEEACRKDADVQKFDNNLKARTGKVMTALAVSANERSFSFDSLKEATTSLLDMDREVMEVILEYKEDVWKNKELFLLVEEFFDNSLATLEFCTAAESSITSAKENQSYLQIALNLVPVGRNPNEREIKSILGALEFFCKAENPFGETFIEKFEAVQERHVSMLIKLRDQKRRLDRKLKNVKVWAKVSSILFGAAVAAVLICSVVAAAIAAPPIAGALAAASSLPLGSMGEWVKSMWKGYENEILAQREVIQRMHIATVVTIHDLDNIKMMAAHLETELKAIIADINFLNEHRDISALRLAMEDITAKRSGFVKELDDLQTHINHVGSRIRQARTIVLQIIAQRTNRRGSPFKS
ncbi:hypothetical protein L7F22_029497 [Adiantum nelumboides]|nr:hypothetical protein [Adiantum nelumboides]MCO5575693.1 hypothetical protein [Adiantum nelumboides]